jgi:hypothetical protein
MTRQIGPLLNPRHVRQEAVVMMKRLVFGTLVGGLLFAAQALGAQAAAATPPQRDSFTYEDGFEIGDCGDGTVLWEDATFNVRIATYSDVQGNPVRMQVHQNNVGVITNSSSGNTYRDQTHITQFFDLAVGGHTTVGHIVLIVVPGAGAVVHDTGRVTFDADHNVTFESGQHQFVDGTAPDLCSVLT